MTAVRLVNGGIYLEGSFIEGPTELDAAVARGASGARGDLPINGLFTGDRIPRADRVTQLGAMALARAARDLPPMEPERVAVITASVLATADTNERFERRRLDGRPPEPRAFPYTAPNAAGGEFSIAMRARGPSLALVGGHEVGVVAVERACRWLVRDAAARVFVVATECPPDASILVTPTKIDPPLEGAVAIVLERDDQGRGGPHVEAEFIADRVGLPVDSLLSLGPLALLWLTAKARRTPTQIDVACCAGASLRVRVT